MRLSRFTHTANSCAGGDRTAKDTFRAIFSDFQRLAANGRRNPPRIPEWCPEPDSDRHSLAAEGF